MAGSAGGGLRAAASHPDRRHRPVADRGATDVAGDDVVVRGYPSFHGVVSSATSKVRFGA